jgi:hypothetical protein
MQFLKVISKMVKIGRTSKWSDQVDASSAQLPFERIAENYLGFLHLACIVIMLKAFLRLVLERARISSRIPSAQESTNATSIDRSSARKGWD